MCCIRSVSVREIWCWVNWNCEIRQNWRCSSKESVRADTHTQPYNVTVQWTKRKNVCVCVCIVTIPKSLCTIIYCEPFFFFVPIPYGRKFVWLEECWLHFILYGMNFCMCVAWPVLYMFNGNEMQQHKQKKSNFPIHKLFSLDHKILNRFFFSFSLSFSLSLSFSTVERIH